MTWIDSLKHRAWPIVEFKRGVDRQLYACNQSRKQVHAYFCELISITRRLKDPSLTIGTGNSRQRDQWVQSAIDEVPPQLRLLDAGSGEQKYRKFCSHLHYFSQDSTAYDGKGDGHGGHVESWTYGSTDFVCDIINIPVPSASFDVILCTEVLEHLPDPIAAVTELSRVLRPGGTLLLTAPFCSFTHFSPFFFSTGFSRNWYSHHLSRLGFGQIELTPNGNFFEYLAQEIRRLPAMSATYCLSSASWREKLAMFVLLRFLQQCSDNDQRSSDYSCFGWHVRAVKNNLLKDEAD